MITQTVTASYTVPQSSLVTILKELAKAKETNQQLKRNMQLNQENEVGTP